MVSCELPGTFSQVWLSFWAGRSQQATVPIDNDWTSDYMCRRVCFVISSCFVQQERRAFETRLPVEVLDWTPLRGEKGVEVTADVADYPNT